MLPPPIIPAPRRVHRKRRAPVASSPTPAALVLMAATFDENDILVRMTFDRAIDIDAMDVAAIVVEDGQFSGEVYQGDGPPMLDGPNVVIVTLASTGGAASPGVHLTAGTGNGIVAVDDGGLWSGVTDLTLPLP